MIRVCVAGATGWTGSAVARAILNDPGLQLVGAVARRAAGQDVGAGPYVAGTLLAVREATTRVGLTRGLDTLLF